MLVTYLDGRLMVCCGGPEKTKEISKWFGELNVPLRFIGRFFKHVWPLAQFCLFPFCKNVAWRANQLHLVVKILFTFQASSPPLGVPH